MAKAKYQGPAERLTLYEALVASVDGVERKGAANPYTSRNGHMTSFIDKEGEVSIRLDQADREEFIEQHRSRIAEQHAHNDRSAKAPTNVMNSNAATRAVLPSTSWGGESSIRSKCCTSEHAPARAAMSHA